MALTAPRARIAALCLSYQLQNRLHSQAARHQFDIVDVACENDAKVHLLLFLQQQRMVQTSLQHYTKLIQIFVSGVRNNQLEIITIYTIIEKNIDNTSLGDDNIQPWERLQQSGSIRTAYYLPLYIW